MTRTCETLGVYPRQRFKINGWYGMTFHIEDGVLWEEDERDKGIRHIADSSVLMEIIDDPSMVVVGDVITANERSLLLSLSVFMGVKWMAKDMNGTIGMFTDKPERGIAAWYATSGSKMWFEQLTSDLVTWEGEEPFDRISLTSIKLEKKTGGIKHD